MAAGNTYTPQMVRAGQERDARVKAGRKAKVDAKSLGGPYGESVRNNPHTIKDLQRFLRNRGYDVAVTGTRDDLTNSAASDFRTNHLNSGGNAADAWNSKYGASSVVTASPKGKTGGSGQAPSAPGLGLDMKTLMGMLNAGANQDMSGTARAMAAAEFDPTINAARRELARSDRQSRQAQLDINNWYAGAEKANQGYTKADAAALTKIMGDSSGLLSNVLGSIGDGAARAQVGKAALTNEKELKALGLIEGNHDRNMGTAIRLSGRDDARNQGRRDRASHDEMSAKILDLLSAKGNAITSHTSELDDRAFSRRHTRFEEALSLAGLQLSAAGNGLDTQLKEARLQKLLQGSGPKPVTSRDLTSASGDALKGPRVPDPNDDTGKGTILDPRLKGNVNEVVRLVNLGFVSHGLHSNDPRAQMARDAILRQYGIKPQRGWSF